MWWWSIIWQRSLGCMVPPNSLHTNCGIVLWTCFQEILLHVLASSKQTAFHMSSISQVFLEEKLWGIIAIYRLPRTESGHKEISVCPALGPGCTGTTTWDARFSESLLWRVCTAPCLSRMETSDFSIAIGLYEYLVDVIWLVRKPLCSSTRRYRFCTDDFKD